jgi:dynein heavy chain
MGQGQEEKAILELQKACKEGTWIFLQNVHLMQSWLKTFERKLEEYSIGSHENFRCFVSSEPPPKALPTQSIVPEAVLQRCIKISNEAPSDLMSNMMRAYSKFSEDRISNAPQTNVFKSILFGLCYFHAVVLGRKKFGSAGWSRIYNFNDGDLTICADVLENYLSKYDKVPYDDLRYIYGEIMYGGHITDDWDRRTNNTYLKVLITPELLNKCNIIPSSKKIVRVPDPSKSDYNDYWEKIEQFSDERPYMFGMHSNAEINFLTNQCDYTFNTIIDIRGGSGGGGDDGDSGPMALVKQYQNFPEPFSLLELRSKVTEINRNAAGVKTATPEDGVKFPPNPYQNVALQECETMTKLIMGIKTSLEELELGLKGDLNMTESMEKLAESLTINRVPGEWGQYYPSKKPLASWFDDMKERYEQLSEWTDEFILPKSICLSFFFNPMSFLTAIMQVTASEQNEALDSMCLNTLVTKFMTPDDIKIHSDEDSEEEDDDSQKEEDEYKDSIFIHGMFLEGASWELNARIGYLTEMKPKELHPQLPVIAVQAVLISEKSMKAQYECPVYYTTMRGPTYVFTANLNMESDEMKERHKWILAGVAAIMNEDF